MQGVPELGQVLDGAAGTVLYCSILYCAVLYCTVLCCTVRQGDVFGFMVEHHAKQGQYRPALALLQVMVSPVA